MIETSPVEPDLKELHPWGWDGAGWFPRSLIAPGQSPAATSWLDGYRVHLRVYVRGPDGQYTEYTYDGGGWGRGTFRF